MLLSTLIQGLFASTSLLAPAALQMQVEAFSGQTALVDPRLLLPACARPDFAWARGGRSVMVHCAAPEWRVFIPVGEGAVVAPLPVEVAAPAQRREPAGPAIRRGDRISLEVGGAGFVIAMDAVAEADSRDGRVALRPVAGGKRLYGVIDDDGHVRLRGLSTVVNGR
jgi:flagella basal body P-ring formation protein FlgA